MSREEHNARVATREYVDVFVETYVQNFVGAIKTFISRKFDPLAQRIATLETRCAAIAMMIARPNTKDAHDLANIEAILARIDVLEKRSAPGATDAMLADRVKALEDRGGGMRYCGVHEPGKPYVEGDMVSRSGSLWICKRLNTEITIPGDGSDAWQLAVKRNHGG